jgi:glycogen debranching enzyme
VSAQELTSAVRHGRYFDAVGRKGVVLGSQEGNLEVWIYPFKLVHGLTLHFRFDGESRWVPASEIAETLTVRPESATIKYAASRFLVEQECFVPAVSLIPEDNPAAAILQLTATSRRPLDILVAFHPDLTPMWPGGLGGQYCFWDESLPGFVLSESTRKFSAVIGAPGARVHSNPPAHFLPDEPTQFLVRIEPGSAGRVTVPIVLAFGADGRDKVVELFRKTAAGVGDLRERTRRYYQSSKTVRIIRLDTDATDLDWASALEWSKLACEKAFACNPELGCGMVAGFGRSGNSARPGFAWYFGGDAYMNLWGMVSAGYHDLARESLRFLRKRQRADGKMMHELSQSAGMIPWVERFPYAYYHADTTPHYLVALWDFVLHAQDLEFLRESWESVKAAYRYCLSTDADKDGLMDLEKAGLAAVETGAFRGKAHEDVYLSAIWVQALDSAAGMAGWMGDPSLQAEARAVRNRASASLERLLWLDDSRYYAFGVDAKGSPIRDLTAWPAVGMAWGVFEDSRGWSMGRRLAGQDMATDWGIRMVSRDSSAYDPVSYNNGAVWPFLSGMTAAGMYRYHCSTEAYRLTRALGRLAFLDSPGVVHELFSGDFFHPVEESVPHQVFSSSVGFLLPLLRGILGLRMEQDHLAWTPQLPAHWRAVEIEGFRVGQASFSLQAASQLYTIRRIAGPAGPPLRVRLQAPCRAATQVRTVRINGVEALPTYQSRAGARLVTVEFSVEDKAEVRIESSP